MHDLNLKEKVIMSFGIKLITEERNRQIESEGWTHQHDTQYTEEQLARAACCYTMPRRWLSNYMLALLWPWDIKWWKPSPDNRVRDLVKAGALIAAEIDRLHTFEQNARS